MKTLTQISKKLVLALVVSAAASQASAVQLMLDSVVDWDNNRSDPDHADFDPSYAGSQFDITASNITWNFDGTTVSGSGTYNAKLRISSSDSEFHHIFSHSIEDFNIVLGGTATAISYECVEGGFGYLIGGNICGNWLLGDNDIDESSMTYNIGGGARNQARNLNGDDVSVGPAQQLANFDLNGVGDNPLYPGDSWFWNGNTLQLVFSAYGERRSIHMTFSAVPVPAAAWLFGSAVLGLAGLKRK